MFGLLIISFWLGWSENSFAHCCPGACCSFKQAAISAQKILKNINAKQNTLPSKNHQHHVRHQK